MQEIKRLKFFADGKWVDSTSNMYMDIFDPSTGDKIAQTPCCTPEEVNIAIKSARDAFDSWSRTPVLKRIQILFNFRQLLLDNLEKLIFTLCTEHGKVWDEGLGDILKIKEAIEVACSVPSLMMGESLMDTSTGYDTVLSREPLGVFAGIAPFNFPGMIPMGWMAPLCITTGNTIVIKASSATPMTSMACADLWKRAGLPDGVLNVITCGRKEAELLLKHPDVSGITFVGSTAIGLHVYSTAAAHGKRVQALCEAKNHALVLEDAPLEQTARSIINASFGCAGERCMALPVVVAQDSIADKIVELLIEYAKAIKIGPAYDKKSEMGPIVSESHRKFILDWIKRGIDEGARLVLDGRNIKVKGYENGFYLGPSIFDHVGFDMAVGQQEIFGPVLCVKRVKTYEEGLRIMNSNRFANGSVIFTQNGHYARDFSRKTHAGMVGVNVGIPVPVGLFPFSGNKDSFSGDLHTLGKDGVRFFTRSKVVTSKWFEEAEAKTNRIDTWDGTLIAQDSKN